MNEQPEQAEATDGQSTLTAGLGDLTERDMDTLRELASAGDMWCRPLDVGGCDGSHHSKTLAKLHRLGFAERKSYSNFSRKTHKYRAVPNLELSRGGTDHD